MTDVDPLSLVNRAAKRAYLSEVLRAMRYARKRGRRPRYVGVPVQYSNPPINGRRGPVRKRSR
jgi:hypothetical protein